MHDIKLIKNNPKFFDEKLRKRNLEPRSSEIISLHNSYLNNLSSKEKLQNKRNELTKQISILAKNKDFDKINTVKKTVLELKENIQNLEEILNKRFSEINSILLNIPNIIDDKVPSGKNANENITVYTKGKKRKMLFNPRNHLELGENLNLLNYKKAQKISGSRFSILSHSFALLHRALVNFLLDIHTKENEYEETIVPELVKSVALEGTGQLPKFEEDLFKTSRDLWLIPTAEVCLTNLGRDSILNFDSLPLRYTSFTNCFRQEAGAAGKDTKGLIREHQFGKVELVSVTIPEKSNQELERMCQCVEKILDKLELRYRKVNLCSGDIGFSSSLTFDFEVWMPGQNKFVEVSSCSNCTDFQSRRMKMRIKNKKSNQIIFPHTLNGSGLAIGRTMVAIIENYQNFDGSINIPEALQLYMGGEKKIEKKSV